MLEGAGWNRGWFASLPTGSKGAVVVGLIGASAIPLVPIALLIAYLTK
ncbi:hypothetical protein [Nocardioides sp. InS609-2]|nr:hypothetical protein [Nocardioides sp. InS609-2]